MSEGPKAVPPERKAAGRALLASGLAFGLLFVLGLTGLASVTLFYIEMDPAIGQGELEDAVSSIVRFLDGWGEGGQRLGLITLAHKYGSYAALVLCGWAALECFLAGGALKASACDGARQAARWVRPLALVGGAVLLLSVGAQIIAGAAAQRAMSELRLPTGTDSPASLAESDRIAKSLAEMGGGSLQSRDEAVVTLHMREMNYPLGFGAIVLLFAVAAIRRAVIVLDAEPRKAVDVSG